MGTFYHTTNYNPLTGDLNNMVKIQKYVVDKNGNGTIKEVKVARDARKKGSGNKQQGGKADKGNPTDFYGPGGMLPTSKIKA